MNSNALCVVMLRWLIGNYITNISQSHSNSTCLKKKTSQNQHFIIIFVDRYQEKNQWLRMYVYHSLQKALC